MLRKESLLHLCHLKAWIDNMCNSNSVTKNWTKMTFFSMCNSTHQQRPVASEDQTWLFAIHKWLFFQLNFGAKIFEIRRCVLQIWRFHWWCHNRLVKSWFREKYSYNLGICTKCWHFGNPQVHFYMKTLFLHQIIQVT